MEITAQELAVFVSRDDAFSLDADTAGTAGDVTSHVLVIFIWCYIGLSVFADLTMYNTFIHIHSVLI